MKLFALIAVTACSFEPPVPSNAPDAPVLRDDARAPAPDVPALGEWSMPELVPGLNSGQNDDDPSLTGDLLELYFASTRLPVSADEDLYVAKRSSTSEPFGAPELVPVVNSGSLDSNVDVTADGLMLVFTSTRDGDADLFVSRRLDRASPWSAPEPLGGLNSSSGEFGAVISGDLLRAVLCSDRDGDEALYAAERTAADQPFDPPVRVVELDTTEHECDAMLPDPQTIYFTRSMGSMIDLDLFVATRSGSEFGASTSVNVLNTPGRDGDPWVSPDQRTMFFASNRAGGAGTPDDIYISTR